MENNNSYIEAKEQLVKMFNKPSDFRHIIFWYDPQKDIIVLQMVLCGDMEVLAECVYAKDYQKIMD